MLVQICLLNALPFSYKLQKNNIFLPKFYVLSKRNSVIISCGFAYIRKMSMLTSKLYQILLGSFRGVAIITVSVVHSILTKFQVQKGITPRKR